MGSASLQSYTASSQPCDPSTGYHAPAPAIIGCGEADVSLWNPSGYHAPTGPGYHTPSYRAITPQNHIKAEYNQQLAASLRLLILLRRLFLKDSACGQLGAASNGPSQDSYRHLTLPVQQVVAGDGPEVLNRAGFAGGSNS